MNISTSFPGIHEDLGQVCIPLSVLPPPGTVSLGPVWHRESLGTLHVPRTLPATSDCREHTRSFGPEPNQWLAIGIDLNGSGEEEPVKHWPMALPFLSKHFILRPWRPILPTKLTENSLFSAPFLGLCLAGLWMWVRRSAEGVTEFQLH